MSAVASRYRVLAKWGSGGMADVYVARQGGAGGFDKLVALKFLRDAGDAVGSRDMFMQELETAALLNHPSIVQTFDAGEIDGRMYMAMEFINGETLSRFHRAVTKRTEIFAPELAIHITRELANALDYAHSLTTLEGEPLGLVHRDISPSNVLLSVDGGVKLLDFGIARVTTKLRATEIGVIKGKFAYMSPEQASGEPIDRRADVYALGILLWQLLVGRQAFEADSDAGLMYQVLHPELAHPSTLGFGTPELDAIVMRALAPKARDRYETAGDLASDLSAYLAKLAAGYEGAKVIREHMTACFAEKKEKLARVIKGLPDNTLTVDELDMLSGASLDTPSPHVMFAPAPEEAEISVSNNHEHPPAPKKRASWVAFAALLALIAPGVIAWKLLTDRDEAATPSHAPTAVSRPAPEPTPAVVAAAEPAVAP
ncbi:MAG: serine/threonine protein kinase, partial [Deltaproteobacteria bacterium]|nr:serine/threonine protein kinase [Deltaproteobacteria bacterium]